MRVKLLLIPIVLLVGIFALTLVPINGNNFLKLASDIFYQETGLDFVAQKLTIRIGKTVTLDFPKADINYNKSSHLAQLQKITIKLSLKDLIKKQYTVSEIGINNLESDVKLTPDGEIEFLDYIKKTQRLDNIHKISVKKYCIKVGDSHQAIGNDFLLKDNKLHLNTELYINNKKSAILKGFVSDFENPTVDILLKTDDISTKLLYPLVQKYGVADLTGIINANLTLKGSLKNIKSSGFLKVRNAGLRCGNNFLKNLNSDIDLSNNKIYINNTTAIANNAPITVTGNIISNKIDIHVFINKFQIKNYKSINSATISANADIKGTYKHLKPVVTTSIENVSAYGVKIPCINAKIMNNKVNVSPFKIKSNNLDLDVVGEITNIDSEKLSYNFKSKGYITPKDRIPKIYINDAYPTICFITGNKKTANINAQVLQSKPNPKVGFTKPVILNLNSRYKNNELSITDCGIYTYTNGFSENLKNNISDSKKLCDITGGLNKTLNLKISIPKPVSLNITHYLVSLQGNLNIVKDKLSGTIKIPSLNDKYGHISARKVYSEINNNNLMFNVDSVNILNNSLSCAGHITLSNNPVVKTLNVKAQEIDTDSLSAMVMLTKHFNLKPVVQKGSFSADKMYVRTHVDSLRLSKVSSGFKIEGQKLYITNLLGEMYNGKFGGNLVVGIQNGSVTGTIQGRGLSSTSVAKSTTKLKEKISGKLDFDMGVNSQLNKKFLNNGDIKFIIRDGQMGILGKVEHLLYAQNIVADKMSRTSLAVVSRAISARDTGLFNYLNGILTLNGENVTIQSIKMQGPNMSMYIRGKYNMTSNIANANILGRLSDTMFSSLGAFGTFTMENFKIALSGEENSSNNISYADIERIPQLPQRNTKEFKAQIYGIAEDKSAVRSFRWISISKKDYRVKEIPHSNEQVPQFINNIN